MKKLSLFIWGVGAFMGVQAQTVQTNPYSNPGITMPKSAIDVPYSTSAVNTTKTRKTRGSFPSTLGTKEEAGKTTYDLQTNGSMQRRILQVGNKISCGWTFSTEVASPTAPYNDRGTGYAHFNGTAWSAAPTARLENVRVGFGGIVLDGAGNENYVSHDPNANQLQNAKKATSGTWTNSALSTLNTNAAIWPHTATSGNWMYIIASPADSNIHTNGIRSGYFFSRSSDNGATWLDNMIPMPMVDSVGHYRGGGNTYAISARGPYVSILFGDQASDMTLITSSNYGATWTKKVVLDWPINNFNLSASTTDINGDNIADTIWSPDGAHSLVVDANGVSHVAFSGLRIIRDGSTAGYTFFPNTSAMWYYNTLGDSIIEVDNILLRVHDCDNNGSIDIGDNYTATTFQAAYGTISYLTQPSITVVPGSPQNVLIAYTCVMDGDSTEDDGDHPYWLGASGLAGQPYRDVLVVGSNDNGGNFRLPVNVSRTKHFEEAFVSTPEVVTGTKLAMLYQGDIEPGTIMQSDDKFDPDFTNFMICQEVSIADIFTLGLDTTAACQQFQIPLGVKNILTSEQGLVKVFPNPTSDMINVSIKMINTAKNLNIDIVDIAGKVVYSSSLTNVTDETRAINVASLSKGLYMLRVSSEAGTISKKFMKD